MSVWDETTGVARRTMVLFFLIDKSGSMVGNKIGAVNDAIVNVLPMVKEIADNNADAEIKVAVLEFSSGVNWLYDEPKLLDDFIWQDVQASGLTSLGEACMALESKLHQHAGFMSSGSGSFAPVVILLSDGEPTDDFEGGLRKLKGNSWFKHAIKLAIAIGNDASQEKLADFTGTSEAVFTVHNIEQLRQMIRLAVITSSMVGSTSTRTGDSGKQETVLEDMKKQLPEQETLPGQEAEKDEWD